MKTSWMIATILGMTSPVLAGTVSFYGGLSGGAAYNSADFSTHGTTDVYSESTLVAHGTFYTGGNSNFLTGIGKVQLGGGITWRDLYLGIEFLGQFSDADFDSIVEKTEFKGDPTSLTSLKNELEMNEFEPAIDLRPGFFIAKETLLYARVGMAFNELTVDHHSDYALINGFVNSKSQYSTSDNVIGLRLGLGVEHHLSGRLSVLFDYTYTQYGDISLDTQDTLGIEDPALEFNFRNYNTIDDITKQTFMLGFNYYI